MITAGDLTADGRARILADGHQMPVLGLGVLSPQDMAELDVPDRTKGTGQAYQRSIWRGLVRRARAVIPPRRPSLARRA